MSVIWQKIVYTLEETKPLDLGRRKLPIYKPNDDRNNIHEIGRLLTKYGIKERNKEYLNRSIVYHSFIRHNHSGRISSNDLGYVAYTA